MNRIKKIIASGTLVCIMATTATVTMPMNEPASIAYAASNIGVTKAKAIALKHAKLKSSDVKFTKAKLDKDDGLTVYDIKFVYDNQEYEYEINAKTGKIVSFDYDLDDDYVADTTISTKKNIGKTKAKAIALAHANLKEANVDYVKVELDNDDGVSIYEVEIEDGDTEYKYEINAKTGKIVSFNYDVDDDNVADTTTSTNNIGKTKAKAIALAHANLKEANVDYVKVEFDNDDGVSIYEVEIEDGDTEYKYEINAKTGKIIEWEMEHDD